MVNIEERCAAIKLVATDIDGVWTDGSIYYSEKGECMKRFSTYDGMGVELLRKAGLEIAVLTGENSKSVQKRIEKLGIEHYFHSQKNKLATMTNLVKLVGISIEQVAYIGDDINDLELLLQAGVTAMPCNFRIPKTFTPDFVTPSQGGKGAFRDFADFILSRRL